MEPKGVVAAVVSAIVILSSIGIAGIVGLVQAEEGQTGGTLRVGWVQEQDTLNPFVTTTVQGRLMVKLLYDSLLRWNKTMVPESMLAESWTGSPDGLTWTYSIARNATWVDGNPLKATDVKFTFDFIKTNNISVFLDQVKYISSITTNGDYEVVVTYSTEVGTVLSDMCLVPIVPARVWSGMTKDQIMADTNANPIGSGAFKLVSWTKATSVVLDANKNYWYGVPSIGRVVFQYYANTETLVNALQNGNIDMIGKELPPTSLSVLDRDNNIKVIVNSDLYYREISINCGMNGGPNTGNPTLGDVHVRQALAMATDKQTLASVVQLGYADPGSTIIQKAASAWWDADIELFPFNISAANKLLNDSGYLDIDDDGIRESPNGTLEMDYKMWILSRWPEEMRTGQMLKTWWSEIGVDLEIVSADANTILSVMYYKYDFFLWGYSGQPDPSFSLLVMLTTQMNRWNGAAYSNASYDALYDQQARETNFSERRAIIYQMQEIIYRDCPYIVLYYMTANGAYRTDQFTGFVSMPTGLLSDVNTFALREVHLIQSQETAQKTDYTPWVVAGLGVVVAVGAVVYVLTRSKGGKGREESDSAQATPDSQKKG